MKSKKGQKSEWTSNHIAVYSNYARDLVFSIKWDNKNIIPYVGNRSNSIDSGNNYNNFTVDQQTLSDWTYIDLHRMECKKKKGYLKINMVLNINQEYFFQWK